LKQGVHDYISKPFDPEELGMLVLKTLKTIDLERVARIHEYDCAVQNRNAALVGSSPPMEELRQMIARAGASRAPVVITGETGTGKNRVAKAIHYDHAGVDKPFVIVNCAAIPENLIESELFGVERGAFTGAVQMKKGLFEMAEGGTLFLDEIGEMPVGVQSKLLGVLDEKTFKKIGGHKMIETDARVIAATNVDIRKALKDRTFRSDLYFRLNIIPMHIPPLREHRDDIPELTRHFIAQFSKKAPITLGSGEMENLTNYEWPGNIRELSNVIERSIILRNSDAIYLSRLISGTPPAGEPFIVAGDAPSMTLRDLEAAHIRKTLGQVSGNYTHAARALGISRSTLMRKINDYGIPV
jgi:DNA-binding NtrC family response regulator